MQRPLKRDTARHLGAWEPKTCAKEGLAEEASETTETKVFIRSQGDSSGIKLSCYPQGYDMG